MVQTGHFDTTGYRAVIAAFDQYMLFSLNTYGSGAFGLPLELYRGSTAFPGGTIDFAVGDINGDGFDDIVYCDGSHIICLLNTFGNFLTTSQLTTCTFSTKVRMADINGDGLTDVLLSQSSAILYYISVSTETIAFAPVKSVPAAFGVSDFRMGDLDGDGHPDIVVCSSTSVYTSLYSPVNGTYPTPVLTTTVLPTGGNAFYLMLLEDVDNDNAPDLAYYTYISSVSTGHYLKNISINSSHFPPSFLH